MDLVVGMAGGDLINVLVALPVPEPGTIGLVVIAGTLVCLRSRGHAA